MYGILLSHLDRWPYLLFWIVRQATKTDMQDCWSFTCCFHEPLAHRQNVASLCLFYRYYFDKCSSELTELVPLPYSQGRPTHYSDWLHDLSVTVPRCYKYVYAIGFFPRTVRLWDFLPIECFPLAYDLSGFKSWINRHLSTVYSF